jgi:hypothetical protein
MTDDDSSDTTHGPNRVPQTLILLLTVTLLVGIFLVGTLLRSQGQGSEVVAAPSTTNAPSPTATPTTTTTVPTTTEPTATTTTAQTSTTEASPAAGLVLQASGLSGIPFGTDAEEAIATITAQLGLAPADSGWVDAFAGFGTCPGTQIRVVRWVSLEAFFSDGPTEWAPAGTQHLFHYGQSFLAGAGEIIDLSTEAGIRLGSTVAELKAAYGPEVLVVDDPLVAGLWQVDVEGAGILWGTVSDTSDAGIVETINGGAGCGE